MCIKQRWRPLNLVGFFFYVQWLCGNYFCCGIVVLWLFSIVLIHLVFNILHFNILHFYILNTQSTRFSANPNLKMNWWNVHSLNPRNTIWCTAPQDMTAAEQSIFGEGLIDIVDWIKFRMLRDINMPKLLTQKQHCQNRSPDC